ncbi:hypothetical protein KCG44_12070 [Pacificimonas sp. WHA3]|uniref:Antifreeze glycopeptide polyprotein n=1 Tax=Pacificimonas pallii TaxID=2827236 RepID=A0ABS6SHX9_9SPHN|nr:hypothetical protein [Pacificimonas pallii]MBV7257521.1 hypothetical protein [Pacificimonas pallii]
MRSAYKRTLSVAAIAAVLAAPAFTQQSLLPDIFDEPPAPETAAPSAMPAAEPATPSPLDQAAEEAGPAETGPPAVVAALPPAPPDPLDTAPKSVRDMSRAGPLTPARGGYGPQTFAGSHGGFMAAMMRRLDAPPASRWAHIVLRRALLSHVETPREIRDADWVAERALLLLKMGEVDGAKLLIDGLPVDAFTPRLYQVASQVHVAAADIPALCPLETTAQVISKDDFWLLMAAVCSGLEGDEGTSATLFNRLRRAEQASDFDILLAERVTSLAGGVGRAANIDWEDDKRLNAYRVGMATAAELEIPAEAWADAPVAASGWAFRSAQTPVAQRAAAAIPAASAGIVSAREMAAISALQAARAKDGEVPKSVLSMRAAYAGRTPTERITAMREIWDAAETPTERHAALIATGPAAARIEPSSALAKEAPALIESMLSAGRYNQALAWWPVLSAADDPLKLEGWAMLVLADRGGVVPLEPNLFRAAYRTLAEEDETRARAGIGSILSSLAGLGRISGGKWSSLFEDFGVDSREDIHTEALARAAKKGRRGEVAVLSAIGLQGGWSGVRPRDVRPILDAWRQVGLGDEARMLAVEAYLRRV